MCAIKNDADYSDEDFFVAVEHKILSCFTNADVTQSYSSELLIEAGKYLCVSHEAKRVRPVLTMFCADALGVPRKSVISLAVASELIHSASLLHDDVIDNATIRRGMPTVNAINGNAFAVLAGNYLLSKAFDLLNCYSHDVTKLTVSAIREMTKAAAGEIEVRKDFDTTLSRWKEIAIGKTGILFAWCGQAVAIIAQNVDANKRFYKCGSHIGVAFQMADDLLDLIDTRALKDRFADIRNKEPSYPILLACQLDGNIKNALGDLWKQEEVLEHEVQEIGDKIIRSDAIKETALSIDKEILGASDSLGNLKDTDGGKGILRWLKTLNEHIAGLV